MDNNAPIKYSDLFQPDNSIKELIGQLKDLSTQYTDLMANIKAQAASIKQSLSSVSGASSQGQEIIKSATAEVEKLAKKNGELVAAQSETAKELASVNAKLRESRAEMKLTTKIRDSEAGSYNRLSAEYSLAKLRLNQMGEEERKTAHGQELEKHAAALYQQMKQLQEVTGKHTLSVGDYGVATANLASDIRNAVQALTQIRIEMGGLEKDGKMNSEKWQELSAQSQKLAKDLKDLKRQYQIVKLEANALGQQTGLLNDAIGVMTTSSGGLSAATGLVNLFGGNAAGAAEALVQVNSAMAIANGLSQVYNGIFKQGNLILAVKTAQTKLATAAQKLQTKSTIAAKAAQIALNLVANANPYVLLAAAIAAVTAGLVLWVSSGARAIKQQKLLNQQTEAALDFMEASNSALTRLSQENQTALSQELAVAKARKAGYAETQQLENQLQAAKEKTNALSRAYYTREISDLDRNRTELIRLRKELLKAQSVQGNKKVSIQLDAEGPAQKFKASKIIDIIQDKIDNLDKKVQIATTLVYDQQQLEADAKALQEEHRQQALEVAALERSALRSSEDVQIALLNQRFNKERALEKANTARKITDLKVQLATENNLTAKARKAINKQIANLQKQLAVTLSDIDNEERQANITAVRDLEDLRFSARQDTADKQRAILKTEYEREKEDLENKLATDRTLTTPEVEALTQELALLWAKYNKDRFELEQQLRLDALDKEAMAIENKLALVSEGTSGELELRLQAIEVQRQQELAQNKLLANDLRQDEKAINDKYDRLRITTAIQAEIELTEQKLEVDQAYEESVFNLKEHSETQIAKFQLQQQKARLQAEIEIQKKLLATQTGEQKALTQATIKALENQSKTIDQKIKTGGTGTQVNNIWELFGFGSDAADALQTVTDQVLDALSEIAQARVEAAEAAVEAAEEEVDAAQSVYDYEQEARANGYASNVEMARKELELSKEKEKKALEEKQKAQEQAEAIDTITQISSLITASANIWSSLSGIPVVGVALALAGIATMWGSFAASKIQAKKLASESYGEGTVELLSGGSHQSGNDVDLGTKSDGTRRRAEGGEFFAIINKRNSRKYRDIIPGVINSLNNGTFAQKYVGAYDKMNGVAFALSGGTSTDVSRLERGVQSLVKQGERRVVVADGQTIEYYGNTKRIIRS